MLQNCLLRLVLPYAELLRVCHFYGFFFQMRIRHRIQQMYGIFGIDWSKDILRNSLRVIQPMTHHLFLRAFSTSLQVKPFFLLMNSLQTFTFQEPRSSFLFLHFSEKTRQKKFITMQSMKNIDSLAFEMVCILKKVIEKRQYKSW